MCMQTERLPGPGDIFYLWVSSKLTGDFNPFPPNKPVAIITTDHSIRRNCSEAGAETVTQARAALSSRAEEEEMRDRHASEGRSIIQRRRRNERPSHKRGPLYHSEQKKKWVEGD